jgi:hypothetical protein
MIEISHKISCEFGAIFSTTAIAFMVDKRTKKMLLLLRIHQARKLRIRRRLCTEKKTRHARD